MQVYGIDLSMDKFNVNFIDANEKEKNKVEARKSLLTSEKGRCHLPMQSLSVHNHRGFVLSELNLKIKAVEEEIEALIKANEELDENYELATGINGVGPVIATDLLIKTGNFININTARKAAYYAGVSPFPNTSGKMVGNSKTSPSLDKKLKALLYMGAKLVVKHNKEYRLYYQKKKLKGKPHYLIMNNVSNKILRTIYSAVKNKTPYNQEYICLDPRENKINSSSKKVA